MPITAALATYRQGIIDTNLLISKANILDQNGVDVFDNLQKNFIINSSFLKMFVHWESFLESVFISYVMGCPSTNNTNVTSYVSAINREHAYELVKNTNSYIDWANHEIVKKLASILMRNGAPFVDNLNAILTELSDLKNIRNAVAHISSSTQSKLDAVASRVLSKQVSNITPADLILHAHPTINNKTILMNYQDILDIAAENIAGNIT